MVIRELYVVIRELYVAGDKGDYWKANHYSYKNSLSRIKMNGNLSRPIGETLGVKQGNIKSSDHIQFTMVQF